MKAESPLTLEGFRNALPAGGAPLDHRFSTSLSWRPIFIRARDGETEAALAELADTRDLELFDTIDRQLEDLASIRFPDPEREADRDRLVRKTVAAAGGESAGVGLWVYLPWARKLVHLLPPDDFHEVVTNRNRNKITLEEQAALRTKRIGVLGLSVGAEAAVAVAQEHLCGELVLADFDALDLSNMNRLNAGVDELGENKARIAARRIARIDPYLRVRIIEEPISEANVQEFLDGLDLLIEECDGLAMKYRVRELARERRLNIVFAGDERGFLSIEPHAHGPELPVFHGRIDRAQPERESFRSPTDFFRSLAAWLGGWDVISERSRGSLEEIGVSLCGYPQLASEARYAAGQIGHVSRRLLLGERLPPFLGHLDLDELIPR